MTFSKFWCGLGEEFPTLSKHAFEVLYLFKILILNLFVYDQTRSP